MDVTINTGGLGKLAADLTLAGARVRLAAPKIVQVHAYRVKQGMRRDFTGHRALGGIPAKVNYTLSDGGLAAEIGVDKGGQGDLANILAFGTARHPASVDMTAAQGRELPNTLKAFEELAAKSVL